MPTLNNHVPIDTRRTETRQAIMALEERIRHEVSGPAGSMAPVECPLEHRFAPGIYARTIFLPAGSLVVGKIHNHAHVNVLSMGRVSVYTEQGPEEFSAPRTWISEPGTKRVVYTHEDAVWNTIHHNPTNETDTDKIEEFVIAKTFEQFDAHQREGLTCLM